MAGANAPGGIAHTHHNWVNCIAGISATVSPWPQSALPATPLKWEDVTKEMCDEVRRHAAIQYLNQYRRHKVSPEFPSVSCSTETTRSLECRSCEVYCAQRASSVYDSPREGFFCAAAFTATPKANFYQVKGGFPPVLAAPLPLEVINLGWGEPANNGYSELFCLFPQMMSVMRK